MMTISADKAETLREYPYTRRGGQDTVWQLEAQLLMYKVAKEIEQRITNPTAQIRYNVRKEGLAKRKDLFNSCHNGYTPNP